MYDTFLKNRVFLSPCGMHRCRHLTCPASQGPLATSCPQGDPGGDRRPHHRQQTPPRSPPSSVALPGMLHRSGHGCRHGQAPVRMLPRPPGASRGRSLGGGSSRLSITGGGGGSQGQGGSRGPAAGCGGAGASGAGGSHPADLQVRSTKSRGDNAYSNAYILHI